MRNRILNAVVRKCGYENWRTIWVFRMFGGKA